MELNMETFETYVSKMLDDGGFDLDRILTHYILLQIREVMRLFNYFYQQTVLTSIQLTTMDAHHYGTKRMVRV